MTTNIMLRQAEIKIPDDMLKALNLQPGDALCLEAVQANVIHIKSPSVVLQDIRKTIKKRSLGKEKASINQNQQSDTALDKKAIED